MPKVMLLKRIIYEIGIRRKMASMRAWTGSFIRVARKSQK